MRESVVDRSSSAGGDTYTQATCCTAAILSTCGAVCVCSKGVSICGYVLNADGSLPSHSADCHFV